MCVCVCVCVLLTYYDVKCSSNKMMRCTDVATVVLVNLDIKKQP